jgi:hypothetical protein
LCPITFSFFENHAVYETMWKNTVQPGKPQMSIWRMRIACWIPKATNTHSENTVQQGKPQMSIWRMRIACWIPKATNTHSEYVKPIAFPLPTIAARTRLNFTFIRQLPVLSVFGLSSQMVSLPRVLPQFGTHVSSLSRLTRISFHLGL